MLTVVAWAGEMRWWWIWLDVWFSWFENYHFHIGELLGLSAAIEFYYGLELNDDAHCRLRLPHVFDARAELRALGAHAGGFI